MPLFGSVKCLNLYFIVLLACLKHVHSTKPIGKKQEYFHAVKKSLNDVNDINSKFKRTGWSANIVRQEEDEALLAGEELGFDLTDEEKKKFKLWRNGVIPYYIDAISYNDKALRDQIRAFLYEVNTATKVNFVELPSPPADDETRFVFFVNRRGQLGCADHAIQNFTNEGVQQVILGYDCLATGNELAEAVLAIAGVPPEHNSPDRDNYIKVNYENIIPEKRYLFQKLKDNEWLFHDLEYDGHSAGHFHFHKHSMNGRLTIEVLDPHYTSNRFSLEGSNKLSAQDILKLRMLYNFSIKKKASRGSECGKLFRKGSNYQKAPSAAWELKSRPKPNRYLGLPDVVTDKTTDEKNKNDAEHKDVGEEENYDDLEEEYNAEPGKTTAHVFRSPHKL
uniref:Metalloendopeptidase n=1 Tax=Heliothis virescens TaxID=7102 RepID=A0A2A4JY00_HELVI